MAFSTKDVDGTSTRKTSPLQKFGRTLAMVLLLVVVVETKTQTPVHFFDRPCRSAYRRRQGSPLRQPAGRERNRERKHFASECAGAGLDYDDRKR
jgi:hypothetical protein